MRARAPDQVGYRGSRRREDVLRGLWRWQPTLLLLPAWSIVHSPDLENAGALPRPSLPGDHFRWPRQRPFGSTIRRRGLRQVDEYAADALAVLDATSTEAPCVVSLVDEAPPTHFTCAACAPNAWPPRFSSAPPLPLAPRSPARRPLPAASRRHLGTDEGWAKDNAAYWQRDLPGFLEFFFSQALRRAALDQAHRGRVAWGLETTLDTLADTRRGTFRRIGRRLRVPARARSAARAWSSRAPTTALSADRCRRSRSPKHSASAPGWWSSTAQATSLRSATRSR